MYTHEPSPERVERFASLKCGDADSSRSGKGNGDPNEQFEKTVHEAARTMHKTFPVQNENVAPADDPLKGAAKSI